MAIDNPIEAVRFWLNDMEDSTFTDPQIQEFLDLEKCIDADGLHPAEDGWTPTYNVLRAAGRGWLWRAGTVGTASAYSAGDVSVTYDKSYCLNRARELMGSKGDVATRRDEPTYKSTQETYYDGPDPRRRA